MRISSIATLAFAVLFAMSVVSVVVALQSGSVRAQLRGERTAEIQKVFAYHELDAKLLRVIIAEKHYLLTQNRTELAEWQNETGKLEAVLAQARAGASGEERRLLDEFSAAYQEYQRLFAEVRTRLEAGDREEALALAHPGLDVPAEEAMRSTSEMRAMGERRLAEIDRMAVENEEQSFRTQFVMAAIIALTSACFAAYIRWRVTAPMEKLAATINEISMGRLEAEIPPELKGYEDEIGDVARAFGRTVVSLKLAVRGKAEKKEK